MTRTTQHNTDTAQAWDAGWWTGLAVGVAIGAALAVLLMPGAPA